MMNSEKLVTGNSRINLRRPGINPPGHALDVGKSHFPKHRHSRETADPMMAMRNDRSVIRQVAQVVDPLRQLPERNERRSFDLAKGVFLRLANIEQHERIAPLSHLCDMLHGNLPIWIDPAHLAPPLAVRNRRTIPQCMRMAMGIASSG